MCENIAYRICNLMLAIMFAGYVILFLKIIPADIVKLITNDRPEVIWALLATVTILTLLVNVVGDVYDKLHKDVVRIYSGEDDPRYKAELNETLEKETINSIKMIEFSSATVCEDIIGKMVRKGCKIHLLICHPNKIHNVYQLDRIRATINNLEGLLAETKDKNNLEIRCYKNPASIRGRLFGDKTICVGWYTYGIKVITGYKNLDPAVLSKRLPYDIFGDKNNLIMADPKTKEGKMLEAMFSRTFDDLWENSIPLQSIEYENELNAIREKFDSKLLN